MFKELFLYFGNQNKMAGQLDVTTQAISQWVRDGKVPPARAIQIEYITNGKFKAVNLVGDDYE
jgi:DNA-binding transcriptional regulator YdaS (Cro superfamily)